MIAQGLEEIGATIKENLSGNLENQKLDLATCQTNYCRAKSE